MNKAATQTLHSHRYPEQTPPGWVTDLAQRSRFRLLMIADRSALAEVVGEAVLPLDPRGRRMAAMTGVMLSPTTP